MRQLDENCVMLMPNAGEREWNKNEVALTHTPNTNTTRLLLHRCSAVLLILPYSHLSSVLVHILFSRMWDAVRRYVLIANRAKAMWIRVVDHCSHQ